MKLDLLSLLQDANFTGWKNHLSWNSATPPVLINQLLLYFEILLVGSEEWKTVSLFVDAVIDPKDETRELRLQAESDACATMRDMLQQIQDAGEIERTQYFLDDEEPITTITPIQAVRRYDPATLT